MTGPSHRHGALTAPPPKEVGHEKTPQARGLAGSSEMASMLITGGDEVRLNGIQDSPSGCRSPDDYIDAKRYPLFMARAVLRELTESLQSTRGAKPCPILTQLNQAGRAVVAIDPKDDEFMPGILATQAARAGVPFFYASQPCGQPFTGNHGRAA